MKNTLLIALLSVSPYLYAQHYYDDIADARQLGQSMKNLVSQHVRTITATGYDARGTKSTDFNEWQEINAASKSLKKTTRNGQQVNRNTYSFDDNFRLISITDSSRDIKSNTKYTYDNKGNLASVVTITHDSLNDFSQTTAHYYQYNESGNPVKLWRVINSADSTEFRFKTDANGNVTDEQLYRRGTPLDLTYYYYNDRNQLTDIVRYDKRTKKLIPVSLFEYDDNGRVIQKMSVLSINRPDYIIWRYIFNEKGLKIKEALFNKQKELTGRIEYAYTFEN